MVPEWTYHNVDSAMFLDAMVWLDSQRALVFGDATEGCFTLLSTHDEGAHWERVSCDSIPNASEGEAAFAASNGNLACHGDTVWIFTGGSPPAACDLGCRRTWTSIDLPVTQGQA